MDDEELRDCWKWWLSFFPDALQLSPGWRAAKKTEERRQRQIARNSCTSPRTLEEQRAAVQRERASKWNRHLDIHSLFNGDIWGTYDVWGVAEYIALCGWEVPEVLGMPIKWQEVSHKDTHTHIYRLLWWPGFIWGKQRPSVLLRDLAPAFSNFLKTLCIVILCRSYPKASHQWINLSNWRNIWCRRRTGGFLNVTFSIFWGCWGFLNGTALMIRD